MCWVSFSVGTHCIRFVLSWSNRSEPFPGFLWMLTLSAFSSNSRDFYHCSKLCINLYALPCVISIQNWTQHHEKNLNLLIVSFMEPDHRKTTHAPIIFGSELSFVPTFIPPIFLWMQTACTSALVTWHCGIEAGERPV